MIPTPLVCGETIRLYIASCDEAMVGLLGYVDVDAKDHTIVLSISLHFGMDIGEAGCFDDNAINTLSIVERDERIWLYYFGYQISVASRCILFPGYQSAMKGRNVSPNTTRACA